jgi:hypothetical protein
VTPLTQDFDAWRRSRPQTGVTATIAGHVVTLPSSIPVGLAAQGAALSLTMSDDPSAANAEASVELLRTVLAQLLGAEVVDALMTGGYGVDELSTLVVWAMANISEPGSMSFDQAAAEAARQGKAATAPARPTPNRGGSGGRSSKRRR